MSEILALPIEIFNLYKAYYELEPWGASRDNLHTAIIASILGNIHRKENSKPFELQDFLLDFNPKNSEPYPIEMLRAHLISWARKTK